MRERKLFFQIQVLNTEPVRKFNRLAINEIIVAVQCYSVPTTQLYHPGVMVL